jgi:hypothetical protein
MNGSQPVWRRVLAPLAALLAGSALIVSSVLVSRSLFAGASKERHRRPGPDTTNRVEVLEARLAAVERMAAMGAPQASSGVGARATRAAGNDGETIASEREQAQRESPEEWVRAREARIATLWAAGRADSQWTDATVLSTRELFAHQEFAGFEVADVSCRTGMCQVHVRSPDEASPTWSTDARERFESAWLMHGPNDVDVQFSYGDRTTGAPESTVYMFKPATSPMRIPNPKGETRGP